MALITCTECGKEFSDKAIACPNCGCPTAEVINCLKEQEEKPSKNICQNCGAITDINEEYCNNCGFRIKPYANTGSASLKEITSAQDKAYTICPNCKTHNPLGRFTCKNCGYKYTLNQYEKSIVLEMFSSGNIQCPTCNSYNVNVSMIAETAKSFGKAETRKKSLITRTANATGRAALNTLTMGAWGILTPKKSKYSESKYEKTTISYQKCAICQSCGHSWKLK